MLYVGFNPREITAYEFIGDFGKWPFDIVGYKRIKELLSSEYVSCCTGSQKPVLDIVERRFEIHVEIPFMPERHRLKKGDKVIIIVVANIRRLQADERYTARELGKARIFFRLYRVTS